MEETPPVGAVPTQRAASRAISSEVSDPRFGSDGIGKEVQNGCAGRVQGADLLSRSGPVKPKTWATTVWPREELVVQGVNP